MRSLGGTSERNGHGNDELKTKDQARCWIQPKEGGDAPQEEEQSIGREMQKAGQRNTLGSKPEVERRAPDEEKS